MDNKVNNAEYYLNTLGYQPFFVVTFKGVYNGENFKLCDYNNTALDDHDFINSNTNNYGLIEGDESKSREIFDFCCDAWEEFYKKECAQQYLIRELIKIDEDDLFHIEYAGHLSTFKTVEFIANFAGVDTDGLLNSDCYELQDDFDDYAEFIDYAVDCNNTIINKIIEKLENLE